MYFIRIIRHFSEIGIILEGICKDTSGYQQIDSPVVCSVYFQPAKNRCFTFIFLAHRKEVDRLIFSSDTIFTTYLFYFFYLTKNTLKGGKYEKI